MDRQPIYYGAYDGPEREDAHSRLVLDDTTIYEVDLDCYECMTEQERREAGLEEIWR